MTPNEKADAAKLALESPIISAAFADIRMRLVEQLESVAFGDVDTQHEITIMLQLLKRLQGQLQRYIQDQAVDKARKKHDAFVEKTRQRLA